MCSPDQERIYTRMYDTEVAVRDPSRLHNSVDVAGQDEADAVAIRAGVEDDQRGADLAAPRGERLQEAIICLCAPLAQLRRTGR